MKTEPSIFVHGPRVLQLPVSNVGGPVYGVSFSGKPRNQGRRGVAMVQWNAEKLNCPGEGERILRLEPQLFWLWFWVRPKLPAVARTWLNMFCPLVRESGGWSWWRFYILWFRSTDYRMYNTKYNWLTICLHRTSVLHYTFIFSPKLITNHRWRLFQSLWLD